MNQTFTDWDILFKDDHVEDIIEKKILRSLTNTVAVATFK